MWAAGLQGVYGAGVFDPLPGRKPQHDFFIGVSARKRQCGGLAKDRGEENLKFYTEYSFRKVLYMGFGNLLKAERKLY